MCEFEDEPYFIFMSMIISLSLIILVLFLQFTFFFPFPFFPFYDEAAVAWGPGAALVLEEVEVDPPRPNEIRIKVICTSLCRSDVTQWESKVLACFTILLYLLCDRTRISIYSLFFSVEVSVSSLTFELKCQIFQFIICTKLLNTAELWFYWSNNSQFNSLDSLILFWSSHWTRFKWFNIIWTSPSVNAYLSIWGI